MNAVIYARYSSYNQTERSIEGQIEDCTAYAVRNGLTIVGSYCDRARSGTSAETRPEFQRMIADSAKHTFDVVLVWKLDRFARNRYDSALYRTQLKKNGVLLKSVTEAISSDPDGIILEGLIESMAEYYSANLSQNVKRGLRIARQRGTFTGGRPIYGYTVVEKKPVPVQGEAAIVQELFERLADGCTLKQIAGDLNARGFRTRSGKPFTPNGFQHLIRNPAVAGFEIRDGERVPSIYPAVISPELFESVQVRLSVRVHTGAREKAPERYYLSGKAFCGECGSALVGESGVGKTGQVYRYYACAKKKAHHTCAKKNIPKNALEDFVVDCIINHILSSDRIMDVCRAVSDYFSSDTAAEKIKTLEAELASVNDSLRKTADLMVMNADLPPLLRSLRDKASALSERAADIEFQLSALRSEKENASPEDVHAWLVSFAKKDFSDPENRLSLIETFLNSVYVFDDHLLIFCNTSPNSEPAPFDAALSIDLPTLPADQCLTHSFSDSPPISQPSGEIRNHAIVIFSKWIAFFVPTTK